MILLVPSTGVASGLTTYLLGVTSVLERNTYACVAAPESDLAAGLPRDAMLIPTDGSREDMTAVLKAHMGDFRVVQTHGRRALLAAFLARWPTRRLAHVFHESPAWRRPRVWSERVLASRAHLAANSPETARRMRAPFRALPTVLPPVIHPFITLPRSDARIRLKIAEDQLAIGVVGRLSKVKRPELALAAAATLPPSIGRRTHTVFIGDGPLRARLEAQAAVSNVTATVLGPIPDARVLLAAFDAIASSSPDETFGVAAAEAILAGVAVAAVDSPGIRFLTANGLPVARPSAPSLAAQLERSLTSGPNTSDGLRQSVIERFGPNAGRQRFRAYYERLLLDTPG